MKELRVYVIKDKPDNYTDEEFIAEAEEQGRVFTLDNFACFVSVGKNRFDNTHIRFYLVDTDNEDIAPQRVDNNTELFTSEDINVDEFTCDLKNIFDFLAGKLNKTQERVIKDSLIAEPDLVNYLWDKGCKLVDDTEFQEETGYTDVDAIS